MLRYFIRKVLDRRDGPPAADRLRSVGRDRGREARGRGGLAGRGRAPRAPDRGADRRRDRRGAGDRGADRPHGRGRRRRHERDGGDLARRDRDLAFGAGRRLRDGRGDRPLPARRPTSSRSARARRRRSRSRAGRSRRSHPEEIDRGPRPASDHRAARRRSSCAPRRSAPRSRLRSARSCRRSATRSSRRRPSWPRTSRATGSCWRAAARWCAASPSSSRPRPGCPCSGAESPLTCVAFGSGQALMHFDDLTQGASPHQPQRRLARRALPAPLTPGRAGPSLRGRGDQVMPTMLGADPVVGAGAAVPDAAGDGVLLGLAGQVGGRDRCRRTASRWPG